MIQGDTLMRIYILVTVSVKFHFGCLCFQHQAEQRNLQNRPTSLQYLMFVAFWDHNNQNIYLDSTHFRSTLTLSSTTTSGKGRDVIINEYYDETGVVAVLESWIKQLRNRKELPYNPYPELVWQARQCAERYMNLYHFYC